MADDEKWAQTMITVTPQDNAVLREYSESTLLSASEDVPSEPGNVVHRRFFPSIYFLSSDGTENGEEELEIEYATHKEIITKDAENQTCLQGVPVVTIPIECRDEASQTVYTSSPCPPALQYYRDIMTSMNQVPLPAKSTTIGVGTVITFRTDISEDEATERLQYRIEPSEIVFLSRVSQDEVSEANARDILHFLLQRVYWICDPKSQKRRDARDEAVQTLIQFNYRTGALLKDNEAQTGLSCEPKQSNTCLLSDYQDIKSLIQTCLENCLDRGIEPVITTDDIIEEIIDKCVEAVRLPMKDEIAQTVATYTLRLENDEDVLRKLKLKVVIDTTESLPIVESLADDILDTVHGIVVRNASFAANDILQTILRRTMNIITRIMEIEMENQPVPIEQIFHQRRKKILDLMSKKATKDSSTQTFIAGVHEARKIEEPRVTLCSVCETDSTCKLCSDDTTGENVRLPYEAKILATRDILFAYKPCYVMATAEETNKYSYVAHSCLPETKENGARLPNRTLYSTSEEGSEEDPTVKVVYKSSRKREIDPRECRSGWSRVIDTALMKPWSRSESGTSGRKIPGAPSAKLFDVSSPAVSTFQGDAQLRTAKALQILKDTFCPTETYEPPPAPPETIVKDERFRRQRIERANITTRRSNLTCTEPRVLQNLIYSRRPPQLTLSTCPISVSVSVSVSESESEDPNPKNAPYRCQCDRNRHLNSGFAFRISASSVYDSDSS